MPDLPATYQLPLPGVIPEHYDHHIRRTLSSMRGQFFDQAAYAAMLAREDTLLYEVYEFLRPEVPGDLLSGISIVHPGKVGDEFYMTKGHFHTILATGEVYYCLQGRGCMVMETPEGDWAVEELVPGRVLVVPPRWAHRSVNTGSAEDLATFYVFPADAGHDYGTIERQGFRKLVVEKDGQMAVIDNPRWQPAQPAGEQA